MSGIVASYVAGFGSGILLGGAVNRLGGATGGYLGRVVNASGKIAESLGGMWAGCLLIKGLGACCKVSPFWAAVKKTVMVTTVLQSALLGSQDSPQRERWIPISQDAFHLGLGVLFISEIGLGILSPATACLAAATIAYEYAAS